MGGAGGGRGWRIKETFLRLMLKGRGFFLPGAGLGNERNLRSIGSQGLALHSLLCFLLTLKTFILTKLNEES